MLTLKKLKYLEANSRIFTYSFALWMLHIKQCCIKHLADLQFSRASFVCSTRPCLHSESDQVQQNISSLTCFVITSRNIIFTLILYSHPTHSSYVCQTSNFPQGVHVQNSFCNYCQKQHIQNSLGVANPHKFSDSRLKSVGSSSLVRNSPKIWGSCHVSLTRRSKENWMVRRCPMVSLLNRVGFCEIN